MDDAPIQPDAMDIFDTMPDRGAESLVCRVCGAVVPGAGEYPQTHWAWHEAANGA
jgi:hypothetical protein